MQVTPGPLPDHKGQARVLVAGIGNPNLGDDGFGHAVTARLAQRPLPSAIQVTDFGVRALDLAYALAEGWRAVILVDAVGGGLLPGTLSVVEPGSGGDRAGGPTIDPGNILWAAGGLAGRRPRILLVACEPADRSPSLETHHLSQPVEAAVDDAVNLVESLARGALVARR